MYIYRWEQQSSSLIAKMKILINFKITLNFEKITLNFEKITLNFEKITLNFEKITLNFEKITLNFEITLSLKASYMKSPSDPITHIVLF